MFKLKLEGNKALIKKLDKINKATRQMLEDNIEGSVHIIESQAKQALQNGITDNGDIQKSGSAEFDKSKLEGQVEFRSRHAPFVEFGTGVYVDVPDGLEDYAMNFYVNGKGTMHPQPYLFPAAFGEYPKMIDRINRGLEKELK